MANDPLTLEGPRQASFLLCLDGPFVNLWKLNVQLAVDDLLAVGGSSIRIIKIDAKVSKRSELGRVRIQQVGEIVLVQRNRTRQEDWPAGRRR